MAKQDLDPYISVVVPLLGPDAPKGNVVTWRHTLEDAVEAVISPLGGSIDGGGTGMGATDFSCSAPAAVTEPVFAALCRAIEAFGVPSVTSAVAHLANGRKLSRSWG